MIVKMKLKKLIKNEFEIYAIIYPTKHEDEEDVTEEHVLIRCPIIIKLELYNDANYCKIEKLEVNNKSCSCLSFYDGTYDNSDFEIKDLYATQEEAQTALDKLKKE